MNSEISDFIAISNSENIKTETLSIRPRKGDIIVEKVALIWT